MNGDGTPLRLSDVADVVEGTWPLIGDAVINDGPGLLLVVEKYPVGEHAGRDPWRGKRARRTAARVCPGSPSIRRSSARPTSSRWRSTTSARSLLLGCLFVVLVLSLFLFDWRTALISLVAIPLSLVAGGAGAAR